MTSWLHLCARRSRVGLLIATAAAALTLTDAGRAWASADATGPVVASILPVQALAAGVMDGVTGGPSGPVLLVPPGRSPHTYALRPSDARALSEATAVFWVGEPLESFLPSLLDGVPKTAAVVPLMTVPGTVALSPRAGGAWGTDHDHDHDHDHARPDHEDHAAIDPHQWLDPRNARAWVAAMAEALAVRDPAHAETYRANAGRLDGRLTALEDEMRRILTPVAERPYLVFHDAYQYLEHRFGMTALGAVTVDPAVPAGAARLTALRQAVKDSGATCVFAEPQFDDRLLKTIAEGTTARVAILDPVGLDAGTGFAAYEQTMLRLARAMAACLSGA